MILGVVVIIGLLVTRFSGTQDVAFPEVIDLPEGVSATAITRGQGWYAVVTTDDDILIFDAATGALRQTVRIQTAN